MDDLPVGALPDQKPFCFVSKPDGCAAQDKTDGNGSETVVHRVSCDLCHINTQKSHAKSEEGGRILKQNDEEGRVFTASYSLQVSPFALGAGKFPECEKPGRSFKQASKAKNDVVHFRVPRHGWVKDVHDPLVKGDAGSHGKDEDSDHEAPEVDLLTVPEGKVLVSRGLGAFKTVKKKDLVPGIHKGVDPLREHGGTAGYDRSDELGDGYERIADESRPDHFF